MCIEGSELCVLADRIESLVVQINEMKVLFRGLYSYGSAGAPPNLRLMPAVLSCEQAEKVSAYIQALLTPAKSSAMQYDLATPTQTPRTGRSEFPAVPPFPIDTSNANDETLVDLSAVAARDPEGSQVGDPIPDDFVTFDSLHPTQCDSGWNQNTNSSSKVVGLLRDPTERHDNSLAVVAANNDPTPDAIASVGLLHSALCDPERCQDLEASQAKPKRNRRKMRNTNQHRPPRTVGVDLVHDRPVNADVCRSEFIEESLGDNLFSPACMSDESTNKHSLSVPTNQCIVSHTEGWRPSLRRHPMWPPCDCNPTKLTETASSSKNSKILPSDGEPVEPMCLTSVCKPSQNENKNIRTDVCIDISLDASGVALNDSAMTNCGLENVDFATSAENNTCKPDCKSTQSQPRVARDSQHVQDSDADCPSQLDLVGGIDDANVSSQLDLVGGMDVLISRANFKVMDSLNSTESKITALGFELRGVTSIFTVQSRLATSSSHSMAIKSLVDEGYLKLKPSALNTVCTAFPADSSTDNCVDPLSELYSDLRPEEFSSCSSAAELAAHSALSTKL